MTITSPFAQIKSASIKIVNERSIYNNTPSEKITIDDLSVDEPNRIEMMDNQNFINAYTIEYQFVSGLAKPNYTTIYTTYDGALDGFAITDIDVAYNAAFMKSNPFYTKDGWGDPDSKNVEPDTAPADHFPYNSWQPDDYNHQYYRTNEEMLIGGINFLAPIVEIGQKSNYFGKLKYIPFEASAYIAQEAIYNAALTKANIPIKTSLNPNYGGSNTSEGSSTPTIPSIMSYFESAYDANTLNDNFKANEYVFLYSETQRPDLLDRNSFTITNGCTQNGIIQITLKNISTPISISVTTDMDEPSLVADAIRAGSYPGWTAAGYDQTILFINNTPGSVNGTCSFNGFNTGVVCSVISSVATSQQSILNSIFKGVRIIAKVVYSTVIASSSSSNYDKENNYTGGSGIHGGGDNNTKSTPQVQETNTAATGLHIGR